MNPLVALAVGFGLGAAAGFLYGLGLTLRVLREIRDSLPPSQITARAALSDAISRFER